MPDFIGKGVGEIAGEVGFFLQHEHSEAGGARLGGLSVGFQILLAHEDGGSRRHAVELGGGDSLGQLHLPLVKSHRVILADVINNQSVGPLSAHDPGGAEGFLHRVLHRAHRGAPLAVPIGAGPNPALGVLGSLEALHDLGMRLGFPLPGLARGGFPGVMRGNRPVVSVGMLLIHAGEGTVFIRDNAEPIPAGGSKIVVVSLSLAIDQDQRVELGAAETIGALDAPVHSIGAQVKMPGVVVLVTSGVKIRAAFSHEVERVLVVAAAGGHLPMVRVLEIQREPDPVALPRFLVLRRLG